MRWLPLLLLLIFSFSYHTNARPRQKRNIKMLESDEESRDGEEEEPKKRNTFVYGMAASRTQEQLSRDAFLALNDATPRQNEDQQDGALLSDKERRQIWLSRHSRYYRRRKEEETSSETNANDEPLRGRESIVSSLTLTSADVVNASVAYAASSQCKGDLFKHKIRVPGCKPKSIANRFCHGSCASFYIPRLRYKKLKATFQSCAACVPSETDLIQVRLECPFREEGELYRTVMRVKKCACRNIVLEGENSDDEESEETMDARREEHEESPTSDER